ncbi:unnamed protein product [Phytophthora fragariaefolia]|uniref:Unnamed protein product n=1 Tax=Phytophthora fragariaefolia TaxID=1490495 RepID=A0A9W7D5N6_9STRA|nr:unnamed protein product [Phytophthora fragariaefolia]
MSLRMSVDVEQPAKLLDDRMGIVPSSGAGEGVPHHVARIPCGHPYRPPEPARSPRMFTPSQALKVTSLRIWALSPIRPGASEHWS